MNNQKTNLTEEQIFKKAYGTLLGVATGDALGMPSSMMSPEAIKNTFKKKITSFLPAPDGHIIHFGMKAGEITDDTQQTLVLADIYLEEGKFSKESVAKRLLAWAKAMDGFTNTLLGPSSIRSLKRIEDGVPIDQAGTMGDTNGAAMRISPVGIVNPGDYDAVIKDVHEVCIPTHNTNIAISGAASVACAVAAGMAGEDIDGVIDAYYYGVNKGMALGTQWYSASISHRAKWALEIARSGKSEEEFLSDLYNYIGAGVVMSEATPTALALFVYYKGDPMKTIMGAANMGGDCDTIGAIAGSIAGAYAGSDAFPQEIIDKLEEVNKLNLKKYAHEFTGKITAKKME
ncbi:MAG: ADP-ribosylglycohydrolase [Ignavibacteriae bacterium HGW-Ignavibacteriae-2]|nr:MAG: ADP-ribosylglycohydrolase [Ignavibacteriae bacterium HGW-Ignavibacteriae-2]